MREHFEYIGPCGSSVIQYNYKVRAQTRFICLLRTYGWMRTVKNVYQTKGDNDVSWFREYLDTSLRVIASTGVIKDAGIIDVGGGIPLLLTTCSKIDTTAFQSWIFRAKLSANSGQVLKLTRSIDLGADITTTELALRSTRWRKT